MYRERIECVCVSDLNSEVKSERADQAQQWFINFSMLQNPLEGVVQYRLLAPTSRISNSVGLGRAQEFTFLISSQQTSMPLYENNNYPYLIGMTL